MAVYRKNNMPNCHTLYENDDSDARAGTAAVCGKQYLLEYGSGNALGK